VIILASDHGEEFMEHGNVKHCKTLFETAIRTPLILHIPGNPMNGTRSGSASNIDILPTLLDFLGIETGGLALDGTSLRPVMDGSESTERVTYSSEQALRGVSNTRFKLIFDLKSNQVSLFDLERDPAEAVDVSADERTQLEEMSDDLFSWLAETEGISEEARRRAVGVARETEEHLRAIGYIE
jgi:arylsulfatase A-like enzyme